MSSAETPLRVLEELGREIDGVIARSGSQPARERVVHTFVLALLGVLLATGAAAAASYVLTGSPIPGSHRADVPPEATPRPGTALLAGLNAADPAGGPAWDLRVSRSETGQVCSAVGQVVEDKFGLVGLDARFRRLPLVGVDACGDRALAAVLIGARVFDAPRHDRVRTVVNGIGGDGLRAVEVTAGATSRTLAPGAGGTFLAVYRGYVEELRPRVTLSYADGSQRTFAFGISAGAQDRDPDGGPSWSATASRPPSGPRVGQTCVQARRARGRTQRFSPLTAPICGDLARDPLFFDVAAFPGADELRTRYPWGGHPPRTLVWGAATGQVEAIDVEVAGARRPVDLSGEGPGFIAVLPGGTDPSAVRVHVTLAGGSARSYVGGQNLRAAGGAAVRSELRAPVAPVRRPPAGVRYLPAIAGTTRIELRAPARDGGPDWALRSFRVRGPHSGRVLDCVALGRIVAGAFRLPGSTAAAPATEEGAVCAQRGASPAAFVTRDETLLDDGLAYAPRPAASVVWGLAPAGARGLTVSGLGASKPVVRTSLRGAFLAVAAPARTQRGFVVRARTAAGRRVSSRRSGFRPASVVPGSERIEARAPDPEGAQPWGLLVWRLRDGRTCSDAGRIVGGQVGLVDPRRSTFYPYPTYEGGACGGGSDDPLEFGISSGPEGTPSALSARRARIQRRTQPGNTVVSGFARSDVRAVTVHSPRDVRTLRPSRRSGAFLVVYDGEFFGGGEIVVDALLANGRTVHRTLPIRQ